MDAVGRICGWLIGASREKVAWKWAPSSEQIFAYFEVCAADFEPTLNCHVKD